MGEFNEMIEMRKWVLGLVAGIPSLSVLLLVFSLGTWKSDIESRVFQDPSERAKVINHIEDSYRHVSRSSLQIEFVPRREVELQLNTIQRNQEKIMNKLNIN